LNRDAINLSAWIGFREVVGGWWYPEDAQVDNRALVRALWTAAQSLGVDVRDRITVEAIQQQQHGHWCSNLGVIREHYVLAAGAWMNELLLLPVRPKKRAISVRVPEAGYCRYSGFYLHRDIYIVPRRGRIVIGATSEEVGFTPHNTSWHSSLTGTSDQALSITALSHPGILVGFRPATPDELPILGSSPCKITLATGHYRNGILLAPVTAALIADLISEKSDSY